MLLFLIFVILFRSICLNVLWQILAWGAVKFQDLRIQLRQERRATRFDALNFAPATLSPRRFRVNLLAHLGFPAALAAPGRLREHWRTHFARFAPLECLGRWTTRRWPLHHGVECSAPEDRGVGWGRRKRQRSRHSEAYRGRSLKGGAAWRCSSRRGGKSEHFRASFAGKCLFGSTSLKTCLAAPARRPCRPRPPRPWRWTGAPACTRSRSARSSSRPSFRRLGFFWCAWGSKTISWRAWKLLNLMKTSP